MSLWALFCQWRVRRLVAAAERWQGRYQAARTALNAKWARPEGRNGGGFNP